MVGCNCIFMSVCYGHAKRKERKSIEIDTENTKQVKREWLSRRGQYARPGYRGWPDPLILPPHWLPLQGQVLV